MMFGLHKRLALLHPFLKTDKMKKIIFFLLLFSGFSSSLTAQTETWQPTKSPKGFPVFCLESIDSFLYAGIGGLGILRTADLGETWDTLNSGLKGYFPSDILRVEDSLLYVSTFHGGVYRSSDFGKNWEEVNEGLEVRFTTSLARKGDKLFVGTSKGVYIFTEGEEKWIKAPLPRTLAPNQVITSLFVSGNNILAGATESLYVSSDDGKQWFEVPEVTNNNIIAIAQKGQKILLGTSGSGILESEGNLNQWVKSRERIGNDSAVIVNVIFSLDENTILKGTNRFGIFYEDTDFNRGLEDLEIRTIARHKGKFFAGTYNDGVVIFDVIRQNLVPDISSLNQKITGVTTLEVLPNPANTFATIQFVISENNIPVSIILLSEDGRLVKSLIVNKYHDEGSHSLQVDLSSLPNGIYYCTLSTKEQRISKQLIVTH